MMRDTAAIMRSPGNTNSGHVHCHICYAPHWTVIWSQILASYRNRFTGGIYWTGNVNVKNPYCVHACFEEGEVGLVSH